ncbi:MAG TPA: prolipoprotein diacylglyceryl transferase family protein [Solirubrobacteraceae bacterium]|nr:prolipoprotein diacylglyceryl transferase family protein [Solirubrobacteraceae bacterium]
MLPEIDVLGLELKTFGIFFALNFVAWGAMAARRFRELGRSEDLAYELVFAALGGGLVGAKLYWAVDNGELTASGLFSGSGLTWYGGLLGGAVAVIAWAKWRGVFTPRLLDIAGIGLPLGYAIGRIGCQVSGDGDYGEPSDLPWAMGYPDGVVPTDPGVEVHPTPLYEALSMGLLAWLLWRARDAFRPGAVFAIYLVVGGIERFLVEFVRRNEPGALGLTSAQLISAAMVAGGAVALALMARGGGLRLGRPAPRSATA